MINKQQAEQILADQAYLFATGEDRGPVLRIFLDEYTGWPSFCTIEAPRLPGRDVSDEVFVALHEAELVNNQVQVDYPANVIDNAPRVAADGVLSTQREDELFSYYEVPIDGVVPSVAHLGSVLVSTDGDVTEEQI